MVYLGLRSDRKQIKVDRMGTGAIAREGDLLFSTISGEATNRKVSEHDGYVFTTKLCSINGAYE